MSCSLASKKCFVGLEDPDAVVHGSTECPNILVAAFEALKSVLPSSGMSNMPYYPVLYSPREDSPSPASDGLIVRLSMSARLAKSPIFSSGLIASVDFCFFGPVIPLVTVY